MWYCRMRARSGPGHGRMHPTHHFVVPCPSNSKQTRNEFHVLAGNPLKRPESMARRVAGPLACSQPKSENSISVICTHMPLCHVNFKKLLSPESSVRRNPISTLFISPTPVANGNRFAHHVTKPIGAPRVEPWPWFVIRNVVLSIGDHL